MKLLVCIKQVPGTSNVAVDPVTGVLIRSGIESKMNPYDLFSLETALRLADESDAQVEVITMGPPAAEAVVREAVCMGCANGVLLSDRGFAGADVLATSYALSQGIRIMGDFDIIFCGKQTTDGDTAQVGAEIAEFLGVPHLANVIAVDDTSDGYVTVKAKQDNLVVTQKLPVPCLLCMDGDINTPRLPSYKRKRAIRNEKVCTVLTVADMKDTDKSHYGLTGSPTQVEKIFPPEKNSEKLMFEGDTEKSAQKLFELLSEKKFI